ncbi:Parallel beta-helix repeat [Acidimicrobiia bacterium]
MSTHFATKTGRVAAGGSLFVGGVAGALVLAPQAGAATTYTVTNTADSGAGSLRQALDDANNNAGADIIVFDAGASGTITLTTGQLDIFDDVTITGLGAADSIISGNNNSRIFYIYNYETSLTVSISGLTMTDGASTNYGGAIANWGNDLTLSSVVLTGNEAIGAGGAIHSAPSISPNTDTNAPLTIIDSEISDNTAGGTGGGLNFYRVGNVTITNTVISGNATVRSGGGIYARYAGNVSIDSSTFDQNTAGAVGGGLYATYTDSFTMTNSTVSGNQGTNGAGLLLGKNGDVLIANSTVANNVGSPNGSGGGALNLWESSGDTSIIFCTISGNASSISTVRLASDSPYEIEITGTIMSDNATNGGSGTQAVELLLTEVFESTAAPSELTLSSSLIMGTTDGDPLIDGGGNVNGVSAQLGALADNGGATFTMEPATGSPVIDAGPLTWTAFAGDGSDQRGGLFLRVSNGQSDMGALEVQPDPAPPTSSTSSTSTSSTSSTTTTLAPNDTTTTLVPEDTTTTVGTDPMVPTFTG